jgi:hypothetical protein
MRSATFLVLSAAVLSCGPDKPAKDPSTETKASDDEHTRWEGAAPPEPTNPSGAGTSSGKGEGGAVMPQSKPERRGDQYDKEATETVLKRGARVVKANCGAAKDEDGKATGPWGKATINITLGHNGHTKDVQVPPPYAGKPSGNCVVQAFDNLTFPPWGGADTQVQWDVEIVQPK